MDPHLHHSCAPQRTRATAGSNALPDPSSLPLVQSMTHTHTLQPVSRVQKCDINWTIPVVHTPAAYAITLIDPNNSSHLMYQVNFNAERLGLAIQANRFARLCLEQSIIFARQRKTFGKPLSKQPVLNLLVCLCLSLSPATRTSFDPPR